MSRIRSIKPEFATSRQLNRCSRDARLLFVLMWCFCDDNGAHVDDTHKLKCEVFPGDASATEDAVGEWLAELVSEGLLARYHADGVDYLCVPTWKRHQKIDRPNPKHPAPPSAHDLAADSTSARRGLDDNSSSVRRGVAPGVESKGRESKGRESPRARSATQSRNGAAAPASGAMTLSADLKIPEGWEAAAAEHRDAARLRPVKLGAEWAKFCAVNDGVTMRNPRSAWLKWALGTRAELQEHDQAPREANGEEHTVVIDPWPQRLAGYAKSPKSWNAMRGHWGPTPDEPGCKAPAEQLQAFRREHRKEPVA